MIIFFQFSQQTFSCPNSTIKTQENSVKSAKVNKKKNRPERCRCLSGNTKVTKVDTVVMKCSQIRDVNHSAYFGVNFL